MSMSQQKRNMIVNQIQPLGLYDKRVAQWLAQAPWDQCVANTTSADLLYNDSGMMLTSDRTTLTPAQMALLLQSLSLSRGDTVLEVGSSGMLLTTIFARVCCSVISVEHDEALHRQDFQVNQTLGMKNIQCIHGDASEGWGHDTYHVVVVNGAITHVTKNLAKSIALGGCLFALLGRGRLKQATLIRHIGVGQWQTQVLFETEQGYLLKDLPSRFDF